MFKRGLVGHTRVVTKENSKGVRLQRYLQGLSRYITIQQLRQMDTEWWQQTVSRVRVRVKVRVRVLADF